MLLATCAHAQNLFIAGSGYTGDIYEIPQGGSLTTYQTGQGGPSGLAFDNSGDLFVTDDTDGNIYEFAPNGTRTTYASGLNGLNGGIAINNLGDVFVDTTSQVLEFTAPNVQTTYASSLDNPGSLAFNNQGDLFVANSGAGSILEFTAPNVQSTFAAGLDWPNGIAFNGAGDLFVAEFRNGKIDEFTAGGESTFSSGWEYPQAMAFDSKGDMYLFEGPYDDTSVIEFTTGGGQVTIASDLSVPTTDGLAFEGIALPVPEPSTYGLLAVGTLALFVFRNRKTKSTATAAF